MGNHDGLSVVSTQQDPVTAEVVRFVIHLDFLAYVFTELLRAKPMRATLHFCPDSLARDWTRLPMIRQQKSDARL